MKHPDKQTGTAFLLIIVMLGLVACQSGKRTSGVKNLKPLTLTRDLRISADNPNVLIGGFNDLSVDGDGNMYATDRRQDRINVFGPDGSYLDSLGRKGKGPGEFNFLYTTVLNGDTLYAMDLGYAPKRLVMFDTNTHSYLGIKELPKIPLKNSIIYTPSQLLPISNNLFDVVYAGQHIPIFKRPQPDMTVVKLSTDFNSIKDTLLDLPPNKMLVYISQRMFEGFPGPFLAKTKISTGPDGKIYVAITDSMRINEYNRNGKFIKAIKADYTPPPFTATQLDSFRNEQDKKVIQRFNQAVEQITIPKRWPAIQHFLVDDRGRCWVELLNPGKPKQTWWVFNADGKPEWEFKLPANIHLYVVKKGEVYGIENNEGGLPAIVRYKISMVQMNNG